MRELIHVLNSVGLASEVYNTPDGTTLLVLRHGGRVLGLYAPESNVNFLWTNPSFVSDELTYSFSQNQNWHNSGGDRTWVGPEVAFFFPQFPRTDKYLVPPELDPGNWQLTLESEKILLTNNFSLMHYPSKRSIAMEISKSISPAPNPLRHEKMWFKLKDVQYAGYSQHVSMIAAKTFDSDVPGIGIWNLLQLPHGGELFIPTYSMSQPSIFFGTINLSDLIVSRNLIRYRMCASGGQKIGIRAVATTGRVGYISRRGDKFELVMRSFFVNPSGEYVDVPWNDFDDVGYSVQACNVNNRHGRFSELEYHAPSGISDNGSMLSKDKSVTWAFRGSQDEIVTVARTLVSAKI